MAKTKSPFLHLDKQQDIAVVTIDRPDSDVNTLTRQMLDELPELLDRLESDDAIRGVVLTSGKDDHFTTGADISLFQQLEHKGEAEELSREGNRLLRRLADLPKPVVAAIHGAALGGGLELALACDYRVASQHKKTRFALPEVQLGLLPGLGGTQRLPRLVGLPNALDMMLTGRNIYARQAKKMGLLDELIHRHGLLLAATNRARTFARSGLPSHKRRNPLYERILETTSTGRSVILSQARKNVLERTQGNYPAPLEILECVSVGMNRGFDTGIKEESRRFDKLVFTHESRMLIRLFFAMQEAKNIPGEDQAMPVRTMGVLGAGLMGAGIADLSAEQQINVLLKDQDLQTASRGMNTIWDELNRKTGKGIITSFERDRQLSRITPAGDYSLFKQADLVIEAVFENLQIKQQVLKEIEESTPDHCIFASNTSAIPLSRIGEHAGRPENLVGMHYFSPVRKMPLLELIVTPQTSERAKATAYRLGVQQGKTVIVVGDSPGFYANRILAPYLNEAMELLDEGVAIEHIDRVMKGYGFPVGPLVLVDEVGLDVAAHVGETMNDFFTRHGFQGSTLPQQLYRDGLKGKKNREGFYTYRDNGKRKEANKQVYDYVDGSGDRRLSPDAITRRLVLPMINEATRCLEEQVLANPADGDLGAILGFGFPAFLGGPFRYIDTNGASTVVEQLETLQKTYGDRFTPSDLLIKHAKKNTAFHTS